MASRELRVVPKTSEVQALRRRLAAQSSGRATRDYWSFSDEAKARAGEDVLFQYPAMMVSPMQGALIDVLREHREGSICVLDPFVGSGTTLIESMRRGLAFTGGDLNPLAVLLAQVETTEAAVFDMRESLRLVLDDWQQARGAVPTPVDDFLARWFRRDVRAELAALSAAIRQQPEPALRRLWWACLAEVCRLSSNARLSTPKLQTRALEELGRQIDVGERFCRLAARAMGVLECRRAALHAAGHLRASRYKPGVRLTLADARALPPLRRKANLVLTSPPYGDNHTTMPYGQASYLPLCWIDLADASDAVPPELLESTRSLDTRSLGGSRLTATDALAESLAEQSPALAKVLGTLRGHSHEAWQRVTSFFADYAEAWDSILGETTRDAHLVITLGDRTVRGLHVPTAQITRELLEARRLAHVDSLHRRIPRNKRIARRNEVAMTIGTETVLVMQRV